MKKSIIGAIILLIIAIVIFISVINTQPIPSNINLDNNLQNQPSTINAGTQTGTTSQAVTHTVEMSTSGFSPNTITINAGDKLIFKTIDSSSEWPASNIHPTHTLYPGSGIQKCGTSEQSIIFDACGSVSQGNTYDFTFNNIGTWRYHNHLNPSKTGTIIVK